MKRFLFVSVAAAGLAGAAAYSVMASEGAGEASARIREGYQLVGGHCRSGRRAVGTDRPFRSRRAA